MTSFTDAIMKSRRGILLSIHVTPGSSETSFPVKYDPWRKTLEMKVQSQAQDSKANMEVLETIAGFFHLPLKDVVLQSGKKNRQKIICVQDISFDQIIGKLTEYFHE
jgi:uncharacterized protein (TIGR00251 family)